jgi:flagellar protein FlaJ
MGFYERTAYRLFSGYASKLSIYFPDLKSDLKKSKSKISAEEFISQSMFTALIVFLFELPIFSLIYGLLFKSFAFAFFTAFTTSVFLSILFFYLYINYPKLLIRDREKKIDNTLHFSLLYLSTIASTKLPLPKIFKMFSKFGKEEIVEEINSINTDVEMFGLDINTALERAIERSPSKKLGEIYYGILSVIRAGGDLNSYLREKSSNMMNEYRRKLRDFAHSLTIYLEIYLVAIILGSIFVTILTAIISGIGGGGAMVLPLQFMMIFVVIPLVSILLIYLVKTATPGGE